MAKFSIVPIALLVCLVIVSVAAQYKDAHGNDCKNMCAVPLSWFPICGENGLTYGNRRALECHEECLRSKIAVKHLGPCQ